MYFINKILKPKQMLVAIIILVSLVILVLLIVLAYLLYYNSSQKIIAQTLSIAIVGLGTLISTILISMKNFNTAEGFDTARKIYASNCSIGHNIKGQRHPFEPEFLLGDFFGNLFFHQNPTPEPLGHPYQMYGPQPPLNWKKPVDEYYNELEPFRLLQTINAFNAGLITPNYKVPS